MELYFLDGNFARITNPIGTVRSVVWSLRYFECGTFRGIFPADGALLADARRAVYLCAKEAADDEVRCGRIEYIGCTGDDEIEISGRMLECLLSDRLIYGLWKKKGRVSDVVHTAVTDNLRGLPVVIGTDSAVIPDVVTGEGEWEPLSDWIYRTLRPFGASYTITLDVEREVPIFRIIYPEGEPSVVFSSSFENIAEVTYESHSAEMKNVAYVTGYDGTTETVDLSDGGGQREIFHSAKDIYPSSFDTTALYREALRARGLAALEGRNAEEYISCMAEGDVHPVFGVDYKLGDLCYVDDQKTGISVRTRVTEADEVWEDGRRMIYPGFGGRLPDIKNKLYNA